MCGLKRDLSSLVVGVIAEGLLLNEAEDRSDTLAALNGTAKTSELVRPRFTVSVGGRSSCPRVT
jgi:hypothetical protein